MVTGSLFVLLIVANLMTFFVIATNGFPLGPKSPPYCNTGCSYSGASGKCSCPSGSSYSPNTDGYWNTVGGVVFVDSNWNGYWDWQVLGGPLEQGYKDSTVTIQVSGDAEQTVTTIPTYLTFGLNSYPGYSFRVYKISPVQYLTLTAALPPGYVTTGFRPLKITMDTSGNITPSASYPLPGLNNMVNLGFNKGNTISGNVYIDANGNFKKDAGESNYTAGNLTVTFTPDPTECHTQGGICTDSNGTCATEGGTTTTSYSCSRGGVCCMPSGSSPAASQTTTTSGGAYTSPTLYPGTYTVSLLPPSGYTMSYPQNGPPPSFSVSVGNAGSPSDCSTNCTVGSSCTDSGTCAPGGRGSIVNLDFGLAKQNKPWYQIKSGGDVRIDNGITNTISSTADVSCGGAYAVTSGGSVTEPGVLYTCDASSNLGSGQASTTNWIVGGTVYPEVYYAGSGNLLPMSYSALSNKLQQSGITPTDMTSVCASGGLTNCTFPANLPNGVYIAHGAVTLNAYTFPAGKNYVFLFDNPKNTGLTIKGKILVPSTSTATFVANGDIIVDRSVGTTPACPPDPQVEGMYSAGRDFIVDGYKNPSTQPDSMLNMQGSIITNAEFGGGSLQIIRDLGSADGGYPAFTITARPDFALHAPELIKETTRIQQEVAP